MAEVQTNGATLHVAEAGSVDAPAVLLLHGVPELWYSWRHQLPALADAGYRAVAPDTRGCGASEAPADVASYSMSHLIGDVVGLLDAMEIESAVLVGALNRYRNLDRDWAEQEPLHHATVEQPALFIGGERDSAVVFADLGPTRALPGLRDVILLPGCGHWVQQERPSEVNAAVVDFLRSLP